MGLGVIPAAAQAGVEGKGLGVRLGIEVELRRGLVGVELQRSGVATAVQRALRGGARQRGGWGAVAAMSWCCGCAESPRPQIKRKPGILGMPALHERGGECGQRCSAVKPDQTPAFAGFGLGKRF